MIEFLKGDTSVKMEIEDMMVLIDTEFFGSVIEALLLLETGVVVEDWFCIEDFLRNELPLKDNNYE